MPTGSPRYRTPALASGEQRVAMLRLELGKDTELWLLMGADQYEKLGAWHRPDDVKRLARIAVFVRPGSPAPHHAKIIPLEPMNVSASEIRARCARGADIAQLVPPAVANYIAEQRLYV